MAKEKPPHPVLTTPRLRLRQFRIEDTAAMHECYADTASMRWWDHLPHTRLIESERAVKACIDCTPSYYRVWAVAELESDRCIGMVNYHDGHIRSRRATLGYLIHPSQLRRGIGREAVTAVIGHCFGELRLHRLQALIHPENAASRGLAEALGFQCEGRLREHMRVGDEWRDALLYGLLTNM